MTSEASCTHIAGAPEAVFSGDSGVLSITDCVICERSAVVTTILSPFSLGIEFDQAFSYTATDTLSFCNIMSHNHRHLLDGSHSHPTPNNNKHELSYQSGRDGRGGHERLCCCWSHSAATRADRRDRRGQTRCACKEQSLNLTRSDEKYRRERNGQFEFNINVHHKTYDNLKGQNALRRRSICTK